MSNYATPILYINMGGEMLYVLQQRLQTQRITPDKSTQVLNDVIHALLNPKQLQIIFDKAPLMSVASLRAILERVVLSSIMKLDANSMNKLFDLMIMMVKYQLTTASGPREVILSTLNHLDAIRDMAVDRSLGEHIELTHRLILDTYGKMSHKEIWQLRGECLHEIQDHNVRVSILLRLGMQNQDTSFNRLIQRYDEKYRDRQEILENVKLLDYTDEEGVSGSLLFFGERLTMLGKNVYSSTYGHVHSSRSSQNLQQLTATSNKSMRQELEALASQLGKEEPIPRRPFSLHLFMDESERAMDCTSSDSNLDDEQKNKVARENVENGNEPVNLYKTNLIENVKSQFSDFPETLAPRTEEMDLLNLLDAV